MKPGQIILLNGSSSAGKTTLALALQQTFREPWQHIALDQFRDGMPGRFRGLNSPLGTPGAQGLNIVPRNLTLNDQETEQTVTHIQFGDTGRQILKGMRRAIAAFAEAGNNVIVDDILFERSFLQDYVQALGHLEVLLVAVRCPLEVVNEREKRRTGRFPGTALSHFHRIHDQVIYDIEVDTSIHSAHRCAERIEQHLGRSAPFRAMSQLKKL